MRTINTFLLVLMSSLFFSSTAIAGVQISTTRIIFPQDSDEVQLTVKNTGLNNQLVQAWVDNIDSSNKQAVPFIVTPPLFKLLGDQTSILHFIFVNNIGLSTDREHVFWANIKSVEATPKELAQQSKLQLAARTRIKLIWRPHGLNKNEAKEAYTHLHITASGSRLIVENPTAYHVSLKNISVDGKDVNPPPNTIAALSMMVAPFSKTEYALPVRSAKTVRWNAIDDYGNGTAEQQQKL